MLGDMVSAGVSYPVWDGSMLFDAVNQLLAQAAPVLLVLLGLAVAGLLIVQARKFFG